MGKSLNERTLVLAHRGASAYAPENTLEAFSLAIDMKADGIETDVYLSKDGRIVILHDEKIERTSNGQGKVSEYTYEELRFFDFGYKFKKGRSDTKIATLDELYELVKPTDMVINIEIKSPDIAILEPMLETAKRYGMTERVFYSSFDHLQLERLLKIAPDAPIGPLYQFNMVKPWLYAENMSAKAVHPNYRQILLDPDYIETCHKKGLRVNTWTVDDEEVAKRLAEMGCDSIMTNRPDVIRRALGYDD